MRREPVLKNLAAEMARRGVTKHDIGTLIFATWRSVHRRIMGEAEFSVTDAVKIRDKFFPDFSVEYLFSK